MLMYSSTAFSVNAGNCLEVTSARKLLSLEVVCCVLSFCSVRLIASNLIFSRSVSNFIFSNSNSLCFSVSFHLNYLSLAASLACNLANCSAILSALLLTLLFTLITSSLSDTYRFLVCRFVLVDIIYFLPQSKFTITIKQYTTL